MAPTNLVVPRAGVRTSSLLQSLPNPMEKIACWDMFSGMIGTNQGYDHFFQKTHKRNNKHRQKWIHVVHSVIPTLPPDNVVVPPAVPLIVENERVQKEESSRVPLYPQLYDIYKDRVKQYCTSRNRKALSSNRFKSMKTLYKATDHNEDGLLGYHVPPPVLFPDLEAKYVEDKSAKVPCTRFHVNYEEGKTERSALQCIDLCTSHLRFDNTICLDAEVLKDTVAKVVADVKAFELTAFNVDLDRFADRVKHGRESGNTRVELFDEVMAMKQRQEKD